jgi:hypothetical protein
MGFPAYILLNEAGRNQEKKSGRDVEGRGQPYGINFDPLTGLPIVRPGIAPYGDWQKDQVWIQKGIDYYWCKYGGLRPPGPASR